jgi:hypothetical protein
MAFEARFSAIDSRKFSDIDPGIVCTSDNEVAAVGIGPAGD